MADSKGLAAVVKGNWERVDQLWRSLLPNMLAEMWSTAKVDELVKDLAQEAWLKDLEASWPKMKPQERRRAVDELGTWLTAKVYETRPHCIRCGRCCQEGGPALLADEAGLISKDGPLAGRAYTVRAGEPVWDGRLGRVREVKRERIKLQDGEGGCTFFDREKGCTVYAHRPAQCRALECWRAEASAWAEEGPFLERAALLAGDKAKLDFVAAHQSRCRADKAAGLAREAALGGPKSQAWAQLIDLIGFDLHVRNFALEKGALVEEELDLVLGRPLALVLAPLGWRVELDQGSLGLSFEEQGQENG